MPLWTPAAITTALWLDAADSATLTLDAGAISQWADKSGNGRHATQATANARPTIISGSVKFDGIDDYLSVDLSFLAGSAYTVAAVARRHTTTNDRAYLYGGTGATANANAIFGWATSSKLRLSQYGNDLEGSDTAGLNTPTLLVGGHTGAGKFIRKNGSPLSSDTQAALVGSNPGGMLGKILALPQSVSIAEVVMLRAAATADTIQQLEGYLAHKWSLESSLPVDHPYKSAAPTVGGAIVGSCEQLWGLRGDPLTQTISQTYILTATLDPATLSEPWGLRFGADLRAPWSSAPLRSAPLVQPWRDAGELVRPLAQSWRDAVGMTAEIEQGWTTMTLAAGLLAQPWALAGDAVAGPLVQSWRLPDRDLVALGLAEPWSLGADPASLRYTVSATVAGVALGVESLTLEADLDQDAITCALALADLADYQRCADGAALVVRCGLQGEEAEEFHLVITSTRIDERHGEVRYQVEAESALVHLGEPWAGPLDGEYTGAAATIAAGLVAPLALDWHTVDWTLPAGCLVAAGETPLALVKRLAAAVGAVVQATPAGSIQVWPEYPVSPPGWADAVPDLVLVETERVEQVASQPERRAGYNRFLIGETMAAEDSLRLEEETISETVKLVRGYQVPWTGAFSLVHTGGSWVQVEDLGVETRQETETVEIVAGEGRVRYPILRRDAVTWQHTNLGALTVSEDGTVRSDVAGQSLCEITYTTSCRKWRVRDGRNEQLQLVAEI